MLKHLKFNFFIGRISLWKVLQYKRQSSSVSYTNKTKVLISVISDSFLRQTATS